MMTAKADVMPAMSLQKLVTSPNFIVVTKFAAPEECVIVLHDRKMMRFSEETQGQQSNYVMHVA